MRPHILNQMSIDANLKTVCPAHVTVHSPKAAKTESSAEDSVSISSNLKNSDYSFLAPEDAILIRSVLAFFTRQVYK